MVSFPPVSQPRPYTPPLLTHTRHMPSPSHSSRFYNPHNIGLGEVYKSFSSSLCNLLHSPVQIILLLVMQSPPFPSTYHLAPRYAISSIPQYKSFSSSLCNLLHSPVQIILLLVMQSPPFPSTDHLAPRYAISSIPQ